MSETSPILFLDFDGTVSRSDVVDALLERFALPAWRRLEEEWRAGTIGSRECLAGQIACVRATPAALDAAIAAIGVDRGLLPLLETAARHAIPVHIVSDGFDYCIHGLLQTLPAGPAERLRGAVHASHLEAAGADTWRTAFPYFPNGCEHGCATCKPAVMARLNPKHRPSMFVGDGLSDRYAARTADVVFAKQSLAGYCEREGIRYTPFADLAMVAAEITRLVALPFGMPARAARLEM